MDKHIFVGFGFGPIQSGLFISEAFKSDNFKRIVVAEIDQKLVDSIRANNGSYYVNIAASDGISSERIDDIEIFNPMVDSDREGLLEALSQATEIVTSLPSVDFYDMGENSVASLIKNGLESSTAPATIIYTAENNNHAAEILEKKIGKFDNVQYLNTVIGKMSQVLNVREEIEDKNLKTIAPDLTRAFLVEEFNKILVTKCNLDCFRPGIEVLVEKEDLLPFEEAKLYGHNAIHALLAYLGAAKGYTKMAELKDDAELMQIARDAFINESGGALIKKYADLNDDLFTEAGYKAYAEDLLVRMTNPYLSDPVERAARDPQRKLSENDRIFGTIKLALAHGIEPLNFIKGALAGLEYFKGKQVSAENIEPLLNELWQSGDSEFKFEIIKLIRKVSSL
jgi:mannitol-1-phosphate 5-dehydrogenase